jgi:hypothetical protein
MNLGLSSALKEAFPENITIAKRPIINDIQIKSPNWLAGFTSGEGCFLVDIFDSKTSKSGKIVRLKFTLIQHTRDAKLMESLIDYLDCGFIVKTDKAESFIVTKFSDIEEKIIPFLVKYPIKGVKSSDFEHFCKVAELIKNKAHLTQEGLDKCIIIKKGMNTGRK